MVAQRVVVHPAAGPPWPAPGAAAVLARRSAGALAGEPVAGRVPDLGALLGGLRQAPAAALLAPEPTPSAGRAGRAGRLVAGTGTANRPGPGRSGIAQCPGDQLADRRGHCPH